jgi:hypothetical protein
VALLHESDYGRIERTRNSSSSDADRLWASKLKHAVKGAAQDVFLIERRHHQHV